MDESYGGRFDWFCGLKGPIVVGNHTLGLQHDSQLSDHARAMRGRLRQEEGIALVMALGITVVLIIFVASMISYTSSNSRASTLSSADLMAHQYADAGLNTAYSILQNQTVVSNGNPSAANLLGCSGATGPTDTNGPSDCSSPTAKIVCVAAASGCASTEDASSREKLEAL